MTFIQPCIEHSLTFKQDGAGQDKKVALYFDLKSQRTDNILHPIEQEPHLFKDYHSKNWFNLSYSSTFSSSNKESLPNGRSDHILRFLDRLLNLEAIQALKSFVQSHSQHTLIDVLTIGIPAFISSSNIPKSLDHLSNHIAIEIIKTLGLFFIQKNLFIFGFVIGFIFDKKVREIVKKVNIVYGVQRTSIERLWFFGGGTLVALVNFPTFLITATLYYSSQWGASLYQTSKKRYSINKDISKQIING